MSSNLCGIVILIFAGLWVWSLFEQRRFANFDGDIKRGILIGREPLLWEIRQTLETLPPKTQYEQGFIRREGREFLIVSDHKYYGRKALWNYVGYINLGAPDSRVEFRIQLPTLIGTIVAVLFTISFLYTLFFPSPESIPLFCLVMIVFYLGIMTISIISNHFKQQKLLMSILNQTTGSNVAM